MKKRVILFILIIGLVYSLTGVLYIKLYKNKPKQVTTKVDEVVDFGYTLKSNTSDYYKNEFEKLKNNLLGEINEEEYLKSTAKLYLIDLYTLSTKVNKYDINTEFIHPDIVNNYKLKLQNTMYNHIEDNSNGNRTQHLPTVSNIEINNIEDTKFKLNDKEYNAKKINASITYQEEEEYDKKAILTIIKENKYYYVVEQKNS